MPHGWTKLCIMMDTRISHTILNPEERKTSMFIMHTVLVPIYSRRFLLLFGFLHLHKAKPQLQCFTDAWKTRLRPWTCEENLMDWNRGISFDTTLTLNVSFKCLCLRCSTHVSPLRFVPHCCGCCLCRCCVGVCCVWMCRRCDGVCDRST